MKIVKISQLRQWCMAGVLAIAGAGGAMGQTIRYVNQNDPGAQYKTIRAAVAVSQPGDTVLVHPGVYQESVTISGIFLKSLRGPEVTVISSADGTGDGVTLSGSQNVTLIGFRVEHFVNGIVINTTAGATKVANCVAAGNTAVGFYLGTSMPLGAQILNNIAADNGGDGVYYNKTTIYDITFSGVINNISYRNGGYGINGNHELIGYKINIGDYNCAYGNNKGNYNPDTIVGSHNITSDPLIDAAKLYRFSNENSPCIFTGNHAPSYNNPDGTPNNMGAYGGPDAANWWRSPLGGPTVQNVTLDPPQVAPGGTITIRATATTE